MIAEGHTRKPPMFRRLPNDSAVYRSDDGGNSWLDPDGNRIDDRGFILDLLTRGRKVSDPKFGL
jgi:hypothetical protein